MREEAFAITPLAPGALRRIAAFEQRYAVTEAPGGELAETVIARHFVLLERVMRDREWRVCKTPGPDGARDPADRVCTAADGARDLADDARVSDAVTRSPAYVSGSLPDVHGQ